MPMTTFGAGHCVASLLAFFAAILGLMKIAFDPSHQPAPELKVPILATIVPQGLNKDDLRTFQVAEAWLLETQEVTDQKPGTTEPISKPKERRLKRVPPTAGDYWQVELPPDALGTLSRLRVKDGTSNWWESNEFNTNYFGNMVLDKKPMIHAQSGVNLSVAWAGSDQWTPTGMDSPGFRYPKFNNYARPIQTFDGRQYYQWRVFIDEPVEVLNTIEQVRYVLHPSFSNRLQSRCDPSTRFALDSSGWGQFQMSIVVRYKSRREQALSYYLDLGKSWPANENIDIQNRGVC